MEGIRSGKKNDQDGLQKYSQITRPQRGAPLPKKRRIIQRRQKEAKLGQRQKREKKEKRVDGTKGRKFAQNEGSLTV